MRNYCHTIDWDTSLAVNAGPRPGVYISEIWVFSNTPMQHTQAAAFMNHHGVYAAQTSNGIALI